jgi:hypothetical protein
MLSNMGMAIYFKYINVGLNRILIKEIQNA